MELALTATGSNLPSLAIPQQLPVANIHVIDFTKLSFGVYVIIWRVSCHVTVSSRLSLKSMPFIYNILSKLLLTLVWFQLRAVLQVKAALTAILYPAVHFLPDYLIRIKIQISETLHSCSWLIFLQNMSKPFFRPRLQGQFLFGDFLYVAFLSSHIEWNDWLFAWEEKMWAPNIHITEATEGCLVWMTLTCKIEVVTSTSTIVVHQVLHRPQNKEKPMQNNFDSPVRVTQNDFRV